MEISKVQIPTPHYNYWIIKIKNKKRINLCKSRCSCYDLTFQQGNTKKFEVSQILYALWSRGVASSFLHHLKNQIGNQRSRDSQFWHEKLLHFCLRIMLTSALRVLVNNLVKESFYGKRKKKTINVLTVFFIFHKSDVKTFLKWIVNKCPKGTR